MENGYAEVIYDALERVTHQHEGRYILPLYACIAHLLATMEYCNNSINSFEVRYARCWARLHELLRKHKTQYFSIYS